MTFLKMVQWKSELASKDESAAKSWNVIVLQVKFDSNTNGVVREGADIGMSLLLLCETP